MRYMTVAEVAETLAVDTDQILAFIRNGDLVAINAAKSRSCKRPLWRIAEADLTSFLGSRSSQG